MEGSGKGRIELVSGKYTFDYESQISKKNNRFDLGLAFPIIGERKISISLDPKIAAKEVGHSDFLQMIEEQIGDHYNKKQIMESLEEFIVLTSEFLFYRSKEKFPSTYQSRLENDHFFIEREHGSFRFEVESYSLENGFFRRVLVKIYPQKPASSQSLFTLFLLPETCDR